MTTTKQSWLKRSLAVLLAVIMVMSMGVADVFAAEEKCPTPEVYNLGATFSLEGYLLSGFVRAGVDINKNGGTGTSGYTYYYTTDGSIPSADNPNAETNGRRDYVMMRNVSSAVVDGVITYKVVATKDGMEDSDVLTYELKISDGRPTFTDASLKSAVMKALGKSGDISTPLTEEEMLELTELSAPSAGITDLAGLEFALNLETLDLSGNDLAETIGDFATAIRNDPFAKLITLNLSNCNLGADDPSLNSNLRRALANLPNLETLNLSDNSLYGVFSLTGGTEEPLSYANLETLDLSSNDLSGITYTSNADFSSLKKIDLSDNRVYLNENAGDWYEKAMEIGLEKIDVSDQKSLTELRGVHILGQTNDFELSYIDNKNNTINLGSALDSTVTFKLQGWGEWQTMSGSLTDDDMPFMIATPSTEADAEDTCFITKELSLGENTFEIILTHVSGETRTYTATIMRSGLPTSDDPDSAGIQDATLQKLVVEALNELSEYEDAPLDYTTHVVTKQEMEKLKTLNGSGEKVTDISGLQYATNLTQLQLYGDFTEVDVSPFTHLTRLVLEGNFTEVDGLSSVTDITSLSLNGSFTTAPDISALTALTSLTVSVAEDLTIPDLKTLSNLRTLNITNCIDGFRWEETSLPRLNQVQLSDCSNTVQIPAFSTDNSRITWNVTTDGTSALVLDVSNLQAATSNTILTVGGTQNSIPSDKITIRGKNNAITTLNFQYVSEIAYDDFSSDSLLNLVFNYVSDISVPQNAVVPNVDNLSGQNSSTKDGAWKTEFNQMTSLNSIALTFSGLTSLKNFDLSQCANLTSLNLSSSTYLQDTLYGERLPSSLETLNLQNTKVDLAGDWTNMKALQNLTLTNTGIYEFPSAVVRQLPTLASLLATSNYYTFIPENTFENSSNLKTLQLGSWIPVIQKDNNIWEIDPDSETGKAIEKLREVSEDVSITNTVSTTGSYSTLIALDSDIGEVEGDPITQTSLTLMVPTDTSSVTLLPTALLKDTVITIEGREYRDGEAIVIPIQEQKQ